MAEPLAGLEQLGWTEFFAEALRDLEQPELKPARVLVEHRNRYVADDGTAEFGAQLAGRLRIALHETGDRPVVGDWIAVESLGGGEATIQARLPRRSKFSRNVAGRTHEEQVLAANIDTVFLATSLNTDLNPRRLERYLLLAWESGAQPVIVLTKADLVEDTASYMEAIRSVAQDTPIHTISARSGIGIESIDPYLLPGSTVAVLGSSGVGKSTLINRLLGTAKLRTGSIREDGRGRHTTTNRQLVRLPNGALIIDTPGLRELQLVESETGLDDAFSDIDQLAGQCKFTDCAHSSEPGCAVRAALADGSLEPERLDSYYRLRQELRHVEERLDPRARGERNRSNRSATKALRDRLKEKGR